MNYAILTICFQCFRMDYELHAWINNVATRVTSSFLLEPAPGHLWRWVQGHPQGPLEDSPLDLRTTGEWNTTSVPPQSRGTWDTTKETEKPAWTGSQIPSGLCQHQVTLGVQWRTRPRSLEDSFWGRPHLGLQTSRHLSCQRRGVYTTQKGFARAPRGAILVPGSLWD
jgi:hypothetical protein